MGWCKNNLLLVGWRSAWTLIGFEPARDTDETQPHDVFNLAIPVSDQDDIPPTQPEEDEDEEEEEDEKPQKVQSRGWFFVKT